MAYKPLVSQEEFTKKAVPQVYPPPIEIEDAPLTDADKERLAKAQEKRDRKNMKKILT